MKSITRLSPWLTKAAVVLALFSAPVFAVTSQSLDIKVSVSVTKSLSAATTTYDYGALAVSVSSVSSAIAITNNSSGLVESYSIQGANAASTAGGTTWTLAASTGTDTYALAAQFSSAQPANADGNWASDDLTTSVINCTTSVLGDGSAGDEGTGVAPAAVRSLWFRLKTPGVVSDTTQHLGVVTVAVQ